MEFDLADNINTTSLDNKTTTALFESGKLCALSGALVEIINNDTSIKSSREILSSKIKTNLRGQDINHIIKITNWLNSPIDICQFNLNNENINDIKNWAIPRIAEVEKEQVKIAFNDLVNKLDYYHKMIPIVFTYQPNIYEARYDEKTIKELSINNNPIKNLLKVANISSDELIESMQQTTYSGRRKKLKDAIQDKIDSLSKEFMRFYSAEQINIIISPGNSYFDLLVESDSYPMLFSERSSGLRWYLDLFVQLKSNDLLDRNILLLLDEPGVQLHIDAQQELLKLFENLSEKNQLVYTTHSPFMINTENLNRIRIVENVSGYSYIHNKVHSANLSQSSKMEIMSPIVRALGFSPKYNIGPNYDKLNLIVEGISDYYYILGATHLCGIHDHNMPNIIPCVGVNNIHNVASILIGWNCKFKIITDFDKEAYKETLLLQKLGLKEGEDYFTINNESADKMKMQESPFLIEDMFTDNDILKFDRGDKFLSAVSFFELSKRTDFELEKSTKDKFIALFKAVSILD